MEAGRDKLVYLAIPMDDIDQSEIAARRSEFSRVLAGLPVRIRTGQDASGDAASSELKDRPMSELAGIVRADLDALEEADVLLADFSNPAHRYVGCVCEVVYAHLAGKPVVVYVGDTDYSERLWLRYHATRICPTLREVAIAISEVLGLEEPQGSG
jgi:nucleoside 2-deoxyribosyltransferase